MTKVLLIALFFCSPLFAAMPPKHFHVDATTLDGEWNCTRSEFKNGRYIEVWSRADIAAGCELENLYIISAKTAHADKADMKKMMKKALFPVRYMPGTRSNVHRESNHEALFEWNTPKGHQAVVRLCVDQDMYHYISYMRKGSDRITKDEISKRVELLDSLKLTFTR